MKGGKGRKRKKEGKERKGRTDDVLLIEKGN